MNPTLAALLDSLSPEGKESVYTSTIIGLAFAVVILVAAFCIRRKNLPSYREAELEAALAATIPYLEAAAAEAEDTGDIIAFEQLRELLLDIDTLAVVHEEPA